MTRSEAVEWHDALIGRSVTDRLVMPIVMYRIARSAAMEDRTRLTAAQLTAAVRS